MTASLTVDEVVESADEEVLAAALRASAVRVVVGVTHGFPNAQPVDRRSPNQQNQNVIVHFK